MQGKIDAPSFAKLFTQKSLDTLNYGRNNIIEGAKFPTQIHVRD